MKTVIALAISLGIVALSPAFAASIEPTEALRYHHHHRHHDGSHAGHKATHPIPGAGIREPTSQEPSIAPYPPGQGNTNGLSRDPEDCNKGCIGGNPG